MARGVNQKLKLLYLRQIFLEQTDENHAITMEQILHELKLRDVSAERKSIYDDLEVLRLFGMDIISEKRGRNCYYYVGSREFELAELKLLVDSVQAAKFITSKKSQMLIRKIESLASKEEAGKLQRQVYVSERIKTTNESIFYSVDQIHEAISADVKIRFRYFQWNVRKEREFRRNNGFYNISPWALLWDDENYYLVGYDEESQGIKHYRVDKMTDLSLSEERRQGRELFEHFDMAVYAKKHFGMFDGEEENVRLEFDNSFAGVAIDRFGRDVTFFPVDEEHFQITVKVAVSRQFLGWIFSLGNHVRIVAPDSVLLKMQEELARLQVIYGGYLKSEKK